MLQILATPSELTTNHLTVVFEGLLAIKIKYFTTKNDLNDRKSTAGYVFSMGSRPITWACKKQQALSLSSAEVEYRAAVNASQEALWLRQILLEFGFEQ